jgi:hypothetical protein
MYDVLHPEKKADLQYDALYPETRAALQAMNLPHRGPILETQRHTDELSGYLAAAIVDPDIGDFVRAVGDLVIAGGPSTFTGTGITSYTRSGTVNIALSDFWDGYVFRQAIQAYEGRRQQAIGGLDNRPSETNPDQMIKHYGPRVETYLHSFGDTFHTVESIMAAINHAIKIRIGEIVASMAESEKDIAASEELLGDLDPNKYLLQT